MVKARNLVGIGNDKCMKNANENKHIIHETVVNILVLKIKMIIIFI